MEPIKKKGRPQKHIIKDEEKVIKQRKRMLEIYYLRDLDEKILKYESKIKKLEIEYQEKLNKIKEKLEKLRGMKPEDKKI